MVGCQVFTPEMEVVVYQVDGAQQAASSPEEAWAAPFTWLNVNFNVKKPLATPVTGILGAPLSPAPPLPQGSAPPLVCAHMTCITCLDRPWQTLAAVLVPACIVFSHHWQWAACAGPCRLAAST